MQAIAPKQRTLRQVFINADTIAAISLVFSMIIGGYNLYIFFRGPNPVIIPPEQITFSTNAQRGQPFESGDLINNVRLSFANNALGDYSDFVQNATITSWVDEQLVAMLTWQFFIVTTAESGPKSTSDVHPIAVPAKSVASQQVSFFPRSLQCDAKNNDCNTRANWVSWGKFLDLLKQGEKLTVLVTAITHFSGALHYSCSIVIDDNVRAKAKTKGYIAPACHPEQHDYQYPDNI